VAMGRVSTGAFRGKLSFRKMSAGGRLCTFDGKPQFWVPMLKVRPPEVIKYRLVV
jgi:hypothetical protein